MADEYRHYLVPVDCSAHTPRMMKALAEHIGCQTCRVTLVAAVSASPTAEIRAARYRHAEEALGRAGKVLLEYGIFPHLRIAEGAKSDCDPAETFARVSYGSPRALYDMVLLGTHQTLVEDYDEPCCGSLADRLCRRLKMPAMILPAPLASPIELLTAMQETVAP